MDCPLDLSSEVARLRQITWTLLVQALLRPELINRSRRTGGVEFHAQRHYEMCGMGHFHRFQAKNSMIVLLLVMVQL